MADPSPLEQAAAEQLAAIEATMTQCHEDADATLGPDELCHLCVERVKDAQVIRDLLAELQRLRLSLEARTQERDKYLHALSNHLCPADIADWVACSGTHHSEDCSVCAETDNGQHRHALLAAKDAAEADLVAERLGNKTIVDEIIRQHRAAEARVRVLEAQVERLVTCASYGENARLTEDVASLHAALQALAAEMREASYKESLVPDSVWVLFGRKRLQQWAERLEALVKPTP